MDQVRTGRVKLTRSDNGGAESPFPPFWAQRVDALELTDGAIVPRWIGSVAQPIDVTLSDGSVRGLERLKGAPIRRLRLASGTWDLASLLAGTRISELTVGSGAKCTYSHSTQLGLRRVSVVNLHEHEWLQRIPYLPTLVVYGIDKFPEWVSRLLIERLVWAPDLISREAGFRRSIELSPYLGRIGTLKEIDIRDAPVRLTPESVSGRRLESIILSPELMEEPPPEICAGGLEAIRSYFRQLADKGSKRLFEAKVLVVGEAGAGKTTLIEKLKDPTCELREAGVGSTEGIDVTHMTFGMPGGGTFRLNYWDFGGQEIYHSTHKFFLTQRSLYVLVSDARKEDTDFYYWLHLIQALSLSSPALLVENQIGQRVRPVGVDALREIFPNLVGEERTNLKTGEDLGRVRDRIQKMALQLSHIGQDIPRTWVDARSVLEGEAEKGPYMTGGLFMEIAESCGVDRSDDRRQLSQYLNDIGVIVHYHDDPILKNLVVLQPQWATDAVYRILDDNAVREAGGRFNLLDAERLLGEASYLDRQHEVIRLMERFGLCYALDGGGSYIAPQLLPSNPPEHDPISGDGLTSTVFRYEFMPKGVVSQVTVGLNHLIEAEAVWRTGVVFQDGVNRARVVEKPHLRRVEVSAAGASPRDLLVVVRHALEQIHRGYPGLSVDELIPCECEVCRNSEPQARELLSAERVIRMLQLGRPVQCGTSGEMVSPLRLLHGVRTDEETEAARSREFGGGLIDQSPGTEPSVRFERVRWALAAGLAAAGLTFGFVEGNDVVRICLAAGVVVAGVVLRTNPLWRFHRFAQWSLLFLAGLYAVPAAAGFLQLELPDGSGLVFEWITDGPPDALGYGLLAVTGVALILDFLANRTKR